MRSAHWGCTMSWCFRYSLSKVRAAFFLTNAFDVLQKYQPDEPSLLRKPRSLTQSKQDVRRDQKPVHLRAQSFAHLPASHIGNGMQGKAVKQFVVIEEVFPDAVDDEMEELVLFVEE